MTELIISAVLFLTAAKCIYDIVRYKRRAEKAEQRLRDTEKYIAGRIKYLEQAKSDWMNAAKGKSPGSAESRMEAMMHSKLIIAKDCLQFIQTGANNGKLSTTA